MSSDVRGPASAWVARRPPRATLTREAIVAAALELLDADGIDGLSLRKLAARLGVGAASLYWHVQDKNELLDLAVDAVIGEVRPGDAGGSWRDELARTGRELRRVMLLHRWVVPLLLTRPTFGPNAMAALEATVSAISRGGFAGVELFHAYSAVITYVTGEVAQEVSAPATEPAPKTDALDLVASLEQLYGREYPVLRTLAPHLLSHEQDPQFEFGLAVVLDGLEARRRESRRQGDRSGR